MKIKAPALGRPMDWSHASNRFIVGVLPVIGAVAGIIALVRGESLWDSTGWGFSAGGAGFIAWAIGRELHPDRVWVATVATVLGPIALAWGRPDLLASAVALLVVRAVAGTTGRSLRWTDLLLLGVVAAPVVGRGSGVGSLAMGAVGLAVTMVWDRRRPVVPVVMVGAYAAGAVTAWLLSDTVGLVAGVSLLPLWIGLAGGIVSLVGPGRLVSVEDRAGGSGLRRSRVWASRLVAVAMAAVVSLTYDPAAMGPVWAALLAVAARPR